MNDRRRKKKDTATEISKKNKQEKKREGERKQGMHSVMWRTEKVRKDTERRLR